MAGDEWQKYANLRLLFGYMFAQPGKKLLFMGGEIAQWSEWNHDGSVDWHALGYSQHQGIQRWVRRPEHLLSPPSRRCTKPISIPRAGAGSTLTIPTTVC